MITVRKYLGDVEVLGKIILKLCPNGTGSEGVDWTQLA
jgi:hypothetical protein